MFDLSILFLLSLFLSSLSRIFPPTDSSLFDIILTTLFVLKNETVRAFTVVYRSIMHFYSTISKKNVV